METSTQNSEQVIFKTSVFGGFEKQDVLSYIDKIRDENQNNVVNLNESIQKMEQAGEELRKQINGFEGKITELEDQLTQKSSKIQELTGQIDHLRRKVSDSSQRRQELKEELDAAKDENAQLSKKAEILNDKAVKYDEVKCQLGEIMISAREDADRVVKSADLKAAQITEKAANASNKVASEMIGLKTEISQIKENLVKLTDAFSQKLSQIDAAIDEMLNNDFICSEEEIQNCEKTGEESTAEEKAEEKENIRIPVSVGGAIAPEARQTRRNEKNFFRRAAKNRRG